MSNPGSPGVSPSTSSVINEEKEKTVKEGVIASENESVESNTVVQSAGSGSKLPSSRSEMDPFVRLDTLDSNDATKVLPIKRRASTGILSKAGKSSSLLDTSKIKLEAMDTATTDGTVAPGSATPSIVKPRRPSVHFAVDAEPKMRTLSTGALAERSKLEGGSRKHRSRKEKLVCRSESPSDLGMEGNEARAVRIAAPAPTKVPISTVATPVSLVSPVLPSVSSVSMSEPLTIDPLPISAIKMEPPSTPTLPTVRTQTSISNPMKAKPRLKRNSSGNTVPRAGTSKKSGLPGSGMHSQSGVREPLLKKKKVIEIVSPRKRKVDHTDILKLSSDPIFIRAANQPIKFKNKTPHHRFKFSRMNLNKNKSIHRGHKNIYNKHRAAHGSPTKREPDTEPVSFPSSLLGELHWVLEEAEKEFPSDSTPKKRQAVANLSASLNNLQSYSSDLISKTSPSKGIGFNRRRVESEPSAIVGLDMSTPGSPSSSLYQIRKEIYFSPSPSYAAPGPSPRRRYSRRRHSKIHPPIEESNCYFQGHHCPNPKVPGSQFCEKHLDQGPSTGYNHCKFMKDGRHCGNIFSSYDATVSYCEQHSNQIAKSEFESRNPKLQPEAMKNIIAKINKICEEGLIKNDVSSLEPISNSDVLELIEEPEGVQDLPLTNFTGGVLEEIDAEGERSTNPDKPDYDSLRNAGYYTTEEIIQIHISKLRKVKALYQREKELEWLIRQHKYRFYKEGLEKLKHCGPKFTTNPYMINRNIELPNGYIDHQIQQYEAAKAILQSAYKVDGQKGLLRLKVLQKSQELAAMAKVSIQKQHDNPEYCDSETDADSDNENSRDRIGMSRHSGNKEVLCAYNDGYAIKACSNPPVCWSNYCFDHILSDPRQVQWKACGRTTGPDMQDQCKTACFKMLEKHGCLLHAPSALSRSKAMRGSEEELNRLLESDVEEEEVGLEEETGVLEKLVADECVDVKHLEEVISKLYAKISLEQPDTSDSEVTDEDCGGSSLLAQGLDDNEKDDGFESDPMQA